MLYALTTCS